MLSQKTLQLLRKYLDGYLKLENEIENKREQLAHNLYFEPYTIFCRLDYKKILHIDINDLKVYFLDNNIIDCEDDLQFIIRKIDIDKDQYISFSEFSRYILPHRDQDLNSLANSRQSYQLLDNKLPSLVEKQLIEVFLAEIELNKRMLQQMQQLKAQPDWDKITAWESVNSGRRWDQKGLQQYFDESKIQYNFKDIENFIYRNSKERDYRINYSDFLYLVFAHEDNNVNYKFFTPQKNQKLISDKKSNLLPKTNFRTNESTNLKSDKFNKHLQSQSHHNQIQNHDDIEVSEFKINEYEDQNILQQLLNKLKIQNQLKGHFLKQLFLQIDENKKGFITLDDLMNYFENILHTPKQIEELIKLVKILDKNKDGIISEKEFCEQIVRHVYIQQF
ncbi:unnamed protein product [Paramecium pentaurelia]|uniref:EF-hand domain-containing protein n=1 Tax=Paramecium pentaurelia TaxID=43138 RepID=A0A8S1UK10_9CILI|nr:unnamed protein product [Paramecium pentaurelia]